MSSQPEGDVEMQPQTPASAAPRDLSTHHSSASSRRGYRQHREMARNQAAEKAPLAMFDSIAALAASPPGLAVSYHGSGRFSVEGEHSAETLQRTRYRAILCTIATVLAFVLIVMLGSFWSNVNWRCAPWDPYLKRLLDGPDDDYLLLIGSAEAGVSMTLTKGKNAPFASDRMAVRGGSTWVSTAVILRLVENGTLSLDDTPQQHLPAWGAPPRGNATVPGEGDPRLRVTLRHLLSFTSGLGALGKAECGESLVACAGKLSEAAAGLQFDPGAVFRVSDNHLTLAVRPLCVCLRCCRALQLICECARQGAMAEAASGRSFDALFQLLLAEPLGMRSEPGYMKGGGGGVAPSGGMDPSQGLRIAPWDYALFLRALLRARGNAPLAEAVRLGFLEDATADVVTRDSAGLPTTSVPGAFREVRVRPVTRSIRRVTARGLRRSGSVMEPDASKVIPATGLIGRVLHGSGTTLLGTGWSVTGRHNRRHRGSGRGHAATRPQRVPCTRLWTRAECTRCSLARARAARRSTSQSSSRLPGARRLTRSEHTGSPSRTSSSSQKRTCPAPCQFRR